MRCCDQEMDRKPERDESYGVVWITWTCGVCRATETGRELPQPQYSVEDLDAMIQGGWII